MATTPDLQVRVQPIFDPEAWRAITDSLQRVFDGIGQAARRSAIAINRFLQDVAKVYPATARNPEHLAAVRVLEDAVEDARREYGSLRWDIRRECREAQHRMELHLWASIQPGVTRTDVLERIAQLYLRRWARDLDVDVADAAVAELRAGWAWRVARSGGRLEPLGWKA